MNPAIVNKPAVLPRFCQSHAQIHPKRKSFMNMRREIAVNLLQIIARTSIILLKNHDFFYKLLFLYLVMLSNLGPISKNAKLRKERHIKDTRTNKAKE